MLADKILESAKIYSNKKAIQMENGFLTYEDLIAKASNRANELMKYTSEMNLKADEPVCGLVFNQGASSIIAILACVISGLIYVPLDSLYPKERLAYMANHSGIKIFITDEAGINLVSDLAKEMENKPQIINIDEVIENDQDFTRPSSHSPNPYVYLLYTSGSTGLPKAVVQRSGSIVHFANAYIDTLKITPEDNLSLFSTFSHDAAVVDIFAGLLSGACLFPLDLRVSENLIRLHNWLKKNEITVWHSVPSLFRMVWSSYRRLVDLPKLRLVVLGGEAVRENDYILCKDKLKTKLYNLYGQTESSYSSGKFINEVKDVECIGSAVRDTQLRIVCNNGKIRTITDEAVTEPILCQTLSNSGIKEGELLISSEFISDGYWKNQEATTQAFIDSPIFGRTYRTGDFVDILEDGRIVFAGRQDNQVKIRGYRVEIGEIESRILQLDGIRECSVLSQVVENQTKLVAFVEGASKFSLIDVNGFLSKILPSYMSLYKIIYIERFPLTVTGKIDKKLLESYLIE